jgi:hypothetical protein
MSETVLEKPYPMCIYGTLPLTNQRARISEVYIDSRLRMEVNGTDLSPRGHVAFVLGALGVPRHRRAQIMGIQGHSTTRRALKASQDIGGRTHAHATALAFSDPLIFMPDQKLDAFGLREEQLQLAAQLAVGETVKNISGDSSAIERSIQRKLLVPMFDITRAQNHAHLVMLTMLSGELPPYLPTAV